MEIRLIATDMDGTFLDDEKNIPEENMKALAECASRGIEIVPATGRTLGGVPEEIKTLPGVRYAIVTNGAVIMDLKENREIDACRMTPGLALQVMELARKSPDEIMYDVYIEGTGYTTEEFYRNIGHFVPAAGLAAHVKRTRRVVPNHIAYIRERNVPADKINLFFTKPEARERMRRALKEIPGILVSSAIPTNLEINAAGADKGSALLRLAAYLGLDREATMGFGDGENDLSMLTMAGIGVAMKNGEESVKAAADYVTLTNNEAGVAAAIRRFALK